MLQCLRPDRVSQKEKSIDKINQKHCDKALNFDVVQLVNNKGKESSRAMSSRDKANRQNKTEELLSNRYVRGQASTVLPNCKVNIK